MFLRQSQSAADSLELARSGRVLTARHGCGEVVAQYHGDVGVLVDGIEQSRHAAVGERGVAYHSHGRPLSGIGGTLCHGDAGTHVYARMYRAERRKEAQRVAANVAEDTRMVVFGQHFVQSLVDIAVSAALTECRRTAYHVVAGGMALAGRQAESLAHYVGIELAGARQLARETALYPCAARHDAAQHFLNHGLTLLYHQHRVALTAELEHLLLRQRIVRNLQQRARRAFGIVLHHVVVGYSGGNDASLVVLALLRSGIYIIR